MSRIKDQLEAEHGARSRIAERHATEMTTVRGVTVGDSRNSKPFELQLILHFELLHHFRRKAQLGWRATAQGVHELHGPQCLLRMTQPCTPIPTASPVVLAARARSDPACL